MTQNAAVFRLNQCYRDHLMLEYFTSGLLKNSLPSEEQKKRVQEVEEAVLQQITDSMKQLETIKGSVIETKERSEPLKVCAAMLNEYFFDARDSIDSVITTYETVLHPLVEEMQISPLDQLKVHNIKLC